MTDVWDLTDKDKGDHVLVALTVDECEGLIATRHIIAEREEDMGLTLLPYRSAVEEIGRCLRDQKDIEV